MNEHPFTEEEADYLLEAIEAIKCGNCCEQCRIKARGLCLYFNIRAKLKAMEARDE